jgi:DNA polymerase III subunit epsilon
MDPPYMTEPNFLRRYRECFGATWADDTPIEAVRFVVLDSETTGLNPTTDRIITIGAVAVQAAEIRLDDVFSALLKVDHNTSAVTVHGVTRDQSLEGMQEPQALEAFLDYVKDGVIVGHHIGHDITVLDAAFGRHWGVGMRNRSLDTMDLTLHLERGGAFRGRPPIRHFSLDALCETFGVIPHDRHTANGDAFITAQVFLRLVRLASRFDRNCLGRICEPLSRAKPEISIPASGIRYQFRSPPPCS